MAGQARVPSPRSSATILLIALCSGWFAATFGLAVATAQESGWLLRSLWSLDDVDVFRRSGGLVLTRVWLDGEWWRVVTAGFVHGSWLHLALNTWALWTIGRWTERAWGPCWQLGVFLVSSVGGCLASVAWAEAPVVVGASAGIFGLAGGLVVARRYGRPELQARLAPVASGRLAFWLGLWLVVGWQLPMLANAGHLGGVCVGAAAGAMLSLRSRVLRIATGGLVAVLVGSFALVARAPETRANYHAFLGFAYLDRGELESAGAAFVQALEREPTDPALQNAVAYHLALAGEQLPWAEELIESALRARPDVPDFVDTLGWVHCRSGRTADGLAALHRAQALSPMEIPEIRQHIADCAGAAVH